VCPDALAQIIEQFDGCHGLAQDAGTNQDGVFKESRVISSAIDR
jgi:hypothetical protein